MAGVSRRFQSQTDLVGKLSRATACCAAVNILGSLLHNPDYVEWLK